MQTSSVATLPRHERRARFVDYRHSGSPDLRSRLVRRHLPLARRVAARFARRGIPFEDLVQVASIGLIRAVDRFDPGRGTSFEAFASPTIVGEIRHHFRDRGWDLRVPRGVQELHLSISRVVERLTAEAGATPTVDDIARAVGASTEQVVEAIEAAGSYRSRSLDDNDAARDPVSRRSIATAISIDDPWLASSDDRLLTERLLVGLPARERLIVHMYFWDQDTQEAIAERLGVSQVHVSRLLRRALAHLRSEIDVAD